MTTYAKQNVSPSCIYVVWHQLIGIYETSWAPVGPPWAVVGPPWALGLGLGKLTPSKGQCLWVQNTLIVQQRSQGQPSQLAAFSQLDVE